MKVSIIVPIFNSEAWIGRCLNSISNQTYTNLEIIALNDGSTDNTQSILDNLNDKDNRLIIIEKENSGTFLTRKLGFEKATGDVIFNADADDFLEPNCIELVVKKMEETKSDIVIGNNYQIANGEKKIIKNTLPYPPTRTNLLRSLLKNEIKGYVWGKLYKAELLKNIDYNVQHLLQEDTLVNLHIFANKNVKIALEPSPIYNYIVHTSSANSSKDPIFIENILNFNQITKNILLEVNTLDSLKDEFKLFSCRNWIVYARLGGKFSKSLKFRYSFYKKNYTFYTKKNLVFYHNIEMLAYCFHHKIGSLTTKMMRIANEFKLRKYANH